MSEENAGFKAFIEKWKKSGASEKANFQLFMSELIGLLSLEQIPGATASNQGDDYAFERPVKNRITGKANFIDLYRRGCFVLEGKQGSDKKGKIKDPKQKELQLGTYIPKDIRKGTATRGTNEWLKEMIKARQQAERYAHSLETDQGLPPFILVVDVGYIIEIYADFSGQGKYEQFPSKKDYRIYMDDLLRKGTQDTLRKIWLDPHSLDASQHAAEVTREVAVELAELGKSYAAEGLAAETVAKFLMRCLFTMFAEDVKLIPKKSFENLLKEARDTNNHKSVAPLLQELWTSMDGGGFSTSIKVDLMKFNGGLFREDKGGTIRALPVNRVQLSLLIRAAEKDWTNVEPSIFGTLLERALSPKDRHKLGAHYTPRPYVERLVGPTIMEPLRADFDAARAAAISRLDKNEPDEARKIIKDFHHELCNIRVLDPACGSGNFLYVAMERMKRLEADVLSLLEDLGEKEPRLMLQGETIDPHQFLGLEINEWAVWAAELVLWIGYLQWHFKTFGTATPSEPVLKDFHNIEKRDALLNLSGKHLRLDEHNKPVTIWDGQSYILSPTTQERIPDPEARVEVYDFDKATKTVWPEAEFIIGNPPFIGRRNIRKSHTEGYLAALGKVYQKVPENNDYVMYWWHKAAEALKAKERKLRRFGFISTNSISQSFNRKLITKYTSANKLPLKIIFAIPDHPWVDNADGAAVRIAMTVGSLENQLGKHLTSKKEEKADNDSTGRSIQFQEKQGLIHPNLTVGPNLIETRKLKANAGICSVGYQLTGKGFSLSRPVKDALTSKEPSIRSYIKKLLTGIQIQRLDKDEFAINVSKLSRQQLVNNYPHTYQYILDNVKPHRDQNSVEAAKKNWWKYTRPRFDFLPALNNIDTMLVSSLTASNRIFVTTSKDTIADSTTVLFALESGHYQAILSSRIHLLWVLSTGGTLEDRPRYNKSQCFDPFPFPDPTPAQTETLRELGEQLDKHRKDRQAEHVKLTLTQMYNVLEKVKAGEVIEGKDKIIYEQGLVGILKQIHDDIDAATAAAYGWPVDLSEEDILKNLVVLNRERALEEAKGHVRWLRPEYQNPDGHKATAKTTEMVLDEPTIVGAAPWPKALPEQMASVRHALLDAGQASVEDIRSQFKRAQTKIVKERLDTLAALGQAEIMEDGRYAA